MNFIYDIMRALIRRLKNKVIFQFQKRLVESSRYSYTGVVRQRTAVSLSQVESRSSAESGKVRQSLQVSGRVRLSNVFYIEACVGKRGL